MGAGTRIATQDYSRAFALGIALNIAIVVVEAIFGFLANSMALIADAGHNLSDVLGLVVGLGRGGDGEALALAALHLRAQESVDPRGADQRLVPAGRGRRDRRRGGPAPVQPGAGRGADDDLGRGGRRSSSTALTAMLFARGRAHDLNVRAAFLHMAADAAVRRRSCSPGLVILWTGQQWVDPVMSLAVAA